MAITIASNINSLLVQRHLSKATDSVSTSLERLSSGLRINRPSDDSASLNIAMGLRTDSRVFSVGVRNTNDAISLLNVVDGALQSWAVLRKESQSFQSKLLMEHFQAPNVLRSIPKPRH